MKTTFSAFVLAAVAISTASAKGPDKNAYEWLSESDNHSMFMEFVNMSDMKDSWNSEKGSYTIFAPTNDAFRRVPSEKLDMLRNDPEKLNMFVKYHVAPGRYGKTELMGRNSLSMSRRADGRASMISLSSDGHWMKVNDATITGGDYWVKNGVIHNIDRVLMPSWM